MGTFLRSGMVWYFTAEIPLHIYYYSIYNEKEINSLIKSKLVMKHAKSP